MSVAVGLSPIPILFFHDNTGAPCVGGSLLTQVGGVNYPTYSDPNGLIALPNPIPLNSRGECSTAAGISTTVFLAQGVSYTFTLSDINSNQLWSIGNISAQQTSIPYAAAAGTNTITATFSPAISLTDGTTVNIKLANTTTASPTFNPNGLGALNVYYSDGVTQWLAGSGIANNTYTLIYNSSLNSSAGGWIVTDPSRVTGSFTGTGTGFSSSPTATIPYAIGQDGKSAVVKIPPATFTGTSNSVNGSITGFPAALTPTSTVGGMCYITDGGTASTGAWSMSGTTMSFGKGNNYGLGNFTNTGTKTYIGGAGSTYIDLPYALSP